MLEFIKGGNIFESKATILVNPVNCVGVCGKGLALEFKKRYPDNFDMYKMECFSRLLRPGHSCESWVDDDKCHDGKRYIVNVATKNHWQEKSKIEYIERWLRNFPVLMSCMNMSSAAIPALGCGEGGLQWEAVKAVILREFSENFCKSHDIEIYEPL